VIIPPKKGKKEKRRKEERNKRKRKKEKEEKKKKGDRCFLQNCSGDQKGPKGPWRVIISGFFL
jgi:hypothetical protein